MNVLISYRHLPRGTYGRGVTKHVCKDANHARNLVKKMIRDKGWNIRKITVWLDETHYTVWLPEKGWTPIREK